MDKLSRNKLSTSTRDNQARKRRRLRRIGTIAAVGLTPVIALAWAGCGDDDESSSFAVSVDPGGTWGAEIAVTVKGRGRVTSTTPGVDCPSNCFTKYIFPSSAADGGSGGIGLKAHATPGSRFTGWTFDTQTPVGSRGRGGANCNPISRPGAQPSVDLNAAEIVLPFNEVQGTPPQGQEGACGGQTTVPVVYNITANFDTPPPPPEAGPDTGVDGGNDETLYQAAAGSTNAADVGYRQDGYLFWRYTTSSNTYAVAYGSNPTGSLNQSAPTPTATYSFSIGPFEVDPYGVVYQTGSSIYVIPYPYTSTPTLLQGGPSSCSAFAVEPSPSSPSVYCRTSSGDIYRWQHVSGSSYSPSPALLYSGVGSGSDLHVESVSSAQFPFSGMAIFYSDSTNIYAVPVNSPDAGSRVTVVSNAFPSSPSNLEALGPGFAWLSSGYVYATPNRAPNSTRSDTSVPYSSSNRYFARDTSNSSYFWAASSSSIYHAFYAGSTATQAFRTGLSGIQGMTADSSYVYTSMADGTIRRASRSPF